MSKPVYPRLRGLMAAEGLTVDMIGQSIGKVRKTVTNKLYGKCDFTVEEAATIRDTYFPDETIDNLFKRRGV